MQFKKKKKVYISTGVISDMANIYLCFFFYLNCKLLAECFLFLIQFFVLYCMSLWIQEPMNLTIPYAVSEEVSETVIPVAVEREGPF